MRFLLIVLTLATIAFTATAYGERVGVSATLNKDQIYIGDYASLRITVSGTSDSSIRPKVPDVDGISITPTGPPTITTMIVNNRTSRELTFNYRISGRKKGEFDIPQIEIVVDDIKYKTRPLKISVIDISKSNRIFIEGNISTDSVYVIAPVYLTYKFYMAPGIEIFDLDFPHVSDAGNMDFYKLSTLPLDDELIIGQNRYHYGTGRETRDGVTYIVYSFKFCFYPTRAGAYTIMPPIAKAGEIKVVRDTFGFRKKVVDPKTEVRAIARPITLTVKPVPEEGKPKGYTGAVGKYSISVSADQTKVKVGDPIELKIKIWGQGLLEKVRRPDLSALKEFSEQFKISETLQPGEQVDNTIVFSQIIRPGSEKITEIPPVRFPYFNTSTGKYEIAESNSMPLDVIETTVVTAGQVIKTPGHEGTLAINKTKIEEKAGGINAIYFHPGALIDQQINLGYLWLLIIPVVGYVVTATIVIKKRRLTDDKAFARSKFARKIVQERLSEARRLLADESSAFYDAVWKGIGGFVSDKMNLGEGELTAYDLDQLRKNSVIDDGILKEMSELLASCDEGRFAANSRTTADKQELLKKSEKLISRLAKELKQ